ncbi:MAG: hypothetical protein HY898_00385 [Deltaproteobacteria bacterium]|nr:hypothetical protein [Deltaproteobacteria bacterium]
MRSILGIASTVSACASLVVAACSANPSGSDPIHGGTGGGGVGGGGFGATGGVLLDGGGDGGDTDDCSDNAKKIFVVSEQGDLYLFDPKVDGLAAYQKLGALTCDLSSSPQTMGVDRSGTAWVFYSSGKLYRVTPVKGNVSCSPTDYKHPILSPTGSYTLGMGFTAKAAGSKEQVLYMLSEDFGLASIDLANSYAVSMTGGLKNISGELTGGPDGRLFTYEADNGKLSEVLLDASYSMQLISTLNDIKGANAWSFARYAGVFYIFTATGSTPSTCSMYDPDTSTFKIRDSGIGFTAVGAGQSTCVPPPPPK